MSCALLWGTWPALYLSISWSLISLTPPSVSLSSISGLCVLFCTHGFCSDDWRGWKAINSDCGFSSWSVNFKLLHHQSSHLPLRLFYSVSPAQFTGPEKSDPISPWGYDAISEWHHSKRRFPWLPEVYVGGSILCISFAWWRVFSDDQGCCMCAYLWNTTFGFSWQDNLIELLYSVDGLVVVCLKEKIYSPLCPSKTLDCFSCGTQHKWRYYAKCSCFFPCESEIILMVHLSYSACSILSKAMWFHIQFIWFPN